MSNIEKPNRFMLIVSSLIPNFLCSVLLFPMLLSFAYQDMGYMLIMLLLFVISVPIALLVGGLFMAMIKAYLTSPILPHFKIREIEGMVAGAIIGFLLGFVFSVFSLKFAICVAITGLAMGLLITIFTDTSIKMRMSS